ncbi:MAG TPA: glycosyltransferase family 2 protein [Candidatus Limnocylindria bacterium]|nr:glycosyltransferase family 2 protein [Candidatus Limnocylindria bacterium]
MAFSTGFSGPTVSIVMPCLNEEETVGVCVTKARTWLSTSGFEGEVIVVDNGSTDRSIEVASRAGARVVHEPTPGYGQAYQRGFAEARGEFIVMGDSDDTYDFSNLTPLLEPLNRGSDLVLGNRFAGGIAEGAMPWAHRYIGSPIINFLIRLFIGTDIGDSQSGLRAFRGNLAERLRLRSGGMEFASEMIVRAARAGLTITEVPAPYAIRQGESKLSTFRDGWRHLRFLLLAAPDYLFILPGLTLTFLGIATLVISFAAPVGVEIGSLTWQPVFAATIFLAIGANTLLLGMIAKIHGCAMGMLPEDRWVRLYRRVFRLEGVLGLAGLMLLIGLALDIGLFWVWASGMQHPLGLQLAALAQTLLIVGAELAMAAFLLVTVDPS